MKIVDRKTFLALPENTLFSKYEPSFFDALTIKGESLENDFLTQEIARAIKCDSSEELSDLCDQSARTGLSIQIDLNDMCRDGCYDDNQLFAVWEHDDVLALIERLKACVLSK